MKLKLQTATRAEDRSTQKQPTQLNMVAARARKPAERPKSTPNLTSSSFFSLPRSECIWISHLQERDFNLVRSARAALCVSRASGNSARKRPKHISKVRVNSSHTPFSFYHCCLDKRPDHQGKKNSGSVERCQRRWSRWTFGENCGHEHVPEPPASSAAPLRLLSLTQPPPGLRRATLSGVRLHIVEIARVTRPLPEGCRGFSN